MGDISLWSHLLFTRSLKDKEVIGQYEVPFLSCIVGIVRKHEFLSCMRGNSDHVLHTQRTGIVNLGLSSRGRPGRHTAGRRHLGGFREQFGDCASIIQGLA